MPTVYILQESKTQDFSDVKRFGTPEVIVVGNITNPAGAAYSVYERLLRKFSSCDFIVPNGSPLGLMAAGAALAYLNQNLDQKAQPVVNTLVWNRRTLSYDLVKWVMPI